ncbi:MAG: glycoside hydrolase family 127 protein [Fimbriimonadaceae bacterium]|nr:glycoside hydrolase family 127 protein [Fimbriimonadaceae bacterium]
MTSLLLFACIMQTQNQHSVVSTLPTGGTNPYYVGNRAPLAPIPMLKLPVGAVRPKGWLLEYLKRQRDGLTGNLGEISAWLEKEDNAWFSPTGTGKWGWEEVPYWLKGYANIGYLLEDEDVIAEAKIWLEGAIVNQRPNGDFGPDHRHASGAKDYWGNMIMLQCLQSYYEHSGDERVIQLMTNYFRFQSQVPDDEFLTGYWENSRGGDNLGSVYWLYNRTGDTFLLDLAHKIHRRTANWMQSDNLPNWHNVNIAQSFDEPAVYWQQTKDGKMLAAARRNFDWVREQFGGVPGGMFGADENARTGRNDARQATETCGFVEQMQSDEEMMRITGDVFWADNCEDVAFNSYPAAVMPDFSALRYLTAPNMVTSDAANHAPGFQNGGPMTVMNPLSNRCCQHNHSHGWPYFAENLWQATNDRGLVAAMYSASEVTAKVGKGESVTITEETHYPFEESIRFTIKSDGEVEFPLYFRIPAWCKQPSVEILGAGEPHTFAGAAGYVKLNRVWKPGDVVVLNLPMEFSVTEWEEQHGAVSVNYGPLTFSLRIEESTRKIDSTTSAVHDALWRDDINTDEWPATEILPASAWNIGLSTHLANQQFELKRKEWPANDFPWTLEDVPYSIELVGWPIPQWKLDRFGLVAELQPSPAYTPMSATGITLIPMGAARLRISVFPTVTTDARAGNQWTEPAQPLPFGPKASHTWGGDDIMAICDEVEPASSSDGSVPRHTFWPRKGSEEWLSYSFESPKTIKGVEVYWFDDTGRGECRAPVAWRVQVKRGEDWVDVPCDSNGVLLNQFNRANFAPVTTEEIRLLIQLRENFSAGVLEWKVIEE